MAKLARVAAGAVIVLCDAGRTTAFARRSAVEKLSKNKTAAYDHFGRRCCCILNTLLFTLQQNRNDNFHHARAKGVEKEKPMPVAPEFCVQKFTMKKSGSRSVFWRLFAVNYVGEKEGIRSWDNTLSH
jgi:hypothetical protein